MNIVVDMILGERGEPGKKSFKKFVKCSKLHHVGIAK
jgi:hypothetical protein